MKIFGFKFGENEEEGDENIINNNELSENKIEVNSEDEINFFKNVYDSTNTWTSNLGGSIIDTFNSAKEKTGQVYDDSLIYFSETTSSITDATMQNFVSVKEKVGDTYAKFEIKNSLYILLDYIDVSLVLAVLYKLPAPPPAKIALILVAQLLVILQEHKNGEKPSIEDGKTNLEVSNLLKNIDLKTVIPIIDQYQKSIPYGKQVLFIIKLFNK